ncbi:unnamed protein product [Gordionus sp. m RMFG-2023]
MYKIFVRIYSTNLAIDPNIYSLMELNNITKIKKHPYMFHQLCVKIPELLEENMANTFIDNNFNPKSVKDEIPKFLLHLNKRQPFVDEYEIKEKSKHYLEEIISKPKYNLNNENMDGRLLEEKERSIKSKIKEKLQKYTYHWTPINFDKKTTLMYVAGKMVPNFAVLYKIFHEIKIRRPEFKPTSILDFGSGVGSVSWAAQTIWNDSLNQHYSVDNCSQISDISRQIVNGRSSSAFRYNLKNFITYKNNLPASKEKFDLVVSAHTLMDIPGYKNREQFYTQLLSNTSKYLKLQKQIINYRTYKTNGQYMPIDFADLYSHINNISIFAPCPHSGSHCPRVDSFLTKTPCAFQVRYFPPKFINAHRSNALSEPYTYIVFEINATPSSPSYFPSLRSNTDRNSNHPNLLNFDTYPDNEIIGGNIDKNYPHSNNVSPQRHNDDKFYDKKSNVPSLTHDKIEITDLKLSTDSNGHSTRPTIDSDDWPRLITPNLLKSRHVHCRLCTHEGKIVNYVMTAYKNGKDAYTCAKKSDLGDLFPFRLSEEPTPTEQ